MLVDIPIADAVDKLTILQIKAERIPEPARRAHVLHELDYLKQRLQSVLSDIPSEFQRLSLVNSQLWEIEDQLRRLEQRQDFGNEFIELARMAYITNDERSSIKREINIRCESRFVEEKQHVDYANSSDLQPVLNITERKQLSQNGEDGVIESIFASIGVTNKYYVEFGCGDGTECNTALLRNNGWNGLWMDREFQCDEPQIHNENVTMENINGLLNKYLVPSTFDLLSIDIDGNDYWIWKAIERRPRVVIVEYNAHLGPNESRVITYDPEFIWNGSDYFGASLRALVELARSKGYTLVYCESTGTNAFFIRDDVLPVDYKPVEIDRIFKRPNYLNQGLCWPRDPDPDREMIDPKHLP